MKYPIREVNMPLNNSSKLNQTTYIEEVREIQEGHMYNPLIISTRMYNGLSE